jgi:hypothetical protein
VQPWIQRAREHADSICLRELAHNKKPRKEVFAMEIARRLKSENMVTKRGDPITATYIIGHALSPTRNGGWKQPEPD